MKCKRPNERSVRYPEVCHHGKANDLGTGLEVAKGRGFGHARMLGRPLPDSSAVFCDIIFGHARTLSKRPAPLEFDFL